MLFLLSICSCEKQDEISDIDNQQVRADNELLVYCGITMIKPMVEIAEIIEKQEKCKIIITKGGSGNLLKSIMENKQGDLYLPGSYSYLPLLEEQSPGIISRKETVGQNRAAIMVQKGNPLQLTNDLEQFRSKEYAVVIGNASSGSIGKETKNILDKKGIYQDVVKNAITLTTDSKDLVKAIRKKEADLVINWYAVYTWDDNVDYMDVIEIDSEYCKAKELVLGLLSCSEHPDIANKFVDLACSETGREIFRKYGLYFE